MYEDTEEQDRLDFLTETYLAAVGDDEEEDGIWDEFFGIEKANQP